MYNSIFHIVPHVNPKCDDVHSNLMKTSTVGELVPKYEFSFCHQYKKFHVNMEDGLCELCQKT